jgi:diaminohydroxyphosphoribosylaminopyrimidine deaminase/5-amino-6-(5-phosphoribosylamino)uracil reductase
MDQPQEDVQWMKRALQLAERGLGRVEPNPMVGCVLVRDQQLIGEGWHEFFGGPHAEINAISNANHHGHLVSGATAFVTLEPCGHHGKTPPCADALIQAGVRRVVFAHADPHPLVAGAGAKRLRQAGVEVEAGLLQHEAQSILAPYLKRVTTGLPWMIAKWAMTWDGKIATATGDSQWISSEPAREIVHGIRGRVDAIMIGVNTAEKDNPLLTARPAGSRVATRIVLDSRARIDLQSQLCQTAHQVPTIIATGSQADPKKLKDLQTAGCEIWQSEASPSQRLLELLRELGRRDMSNVLIEGGAGLLGSLFDLRQIDELHLFIGGKIFGGRDSLSPVGGVGVLKVFDSQTIDLRNVSRIGNDVYMIGRTQ